MAMPGMVGGGGLSFQQAMAIVQSSPEQFAGIPPAMAAMQLVAQGQQMSQPPVEITPSNPAPVEAGVPMQAPPIGAMPGAGAMAEDYRSQDALRAAIERGISGSSMAGGEGDEELVGSGGADVVAPAATAPAKASYEDLMEKARTAAATRRAAATSGVTIDPELDEILKAREARAEGDLSTVDADKKQQMWLAVMLAGAKMAQSQSPYLASALGAGLEAGALGFNKARAEAAERKARILDKKEEVAISRITAKDAAVQFALQNANAVEEEARANLNAPLEYAKAERAAEQAAIDLDIAKRFGVPEAQAKIALLNSQVQAQRANAAQSYAAAYASRATVARAAERNELPGSVADIYTANLRAAENLLTRAEEATGEEAESYKKQAKALSDRASMVIAPYFPAQAPAPSPGTPPPGAVRLKG
jgi:hypothetical protein